MFHSRRLYSNINRIREKALRIAHNHNQSTFNILLENYCPVCIHKLVGGRMGGCACYGEEVQSPWNTHTVLGIFHPRPIFAAEMTIVSSLPPSFHVKSIAEALSYLERLNFSLQCYSYPPSTTLLYGGVDFVVRLRINHRKCSNTFGRHCIIDCRVFVEGWAPHFIKDFTPPMFPSAQNSQLHFRGHRR